MPDANLIRDIIHQVVDQEPVACLEYCDKALRDSDLPPQLQMLVRVAKSSALINTGDISGGQAELTAALHEAAFGADRFVCCLVLAAFGFWKEAVEHLSTDSAEESRPEEWFALFGTLHHTLFAGLDRLDDHVSNGLFLEPPGVDGSLTWFVDSANIEEKRSEILEVMEPAAALFPNNVDLQAILAHLAFEGGDHAKVVSVCERLRAADPTNRHLFFEARSLANLAPANQAEQAVRVQLLIVLREIKERLSTALANGQGSDVLEPIIAQAKSLGDLRVLSCEIGSMESLCHGTEHTRTIVSPAESVSITVKVAVEGDVQIREQVAETCGSSLYQLRDTEVLDMTGMLLIGGRQVARDPMPEDPWFMNHWPYLHLSSVDQCLLTPPAATAWRGPSAASIAQGFGANYYTWLIEVMPRIQLLEDHCGELPALVFLYELSPWQRAILDLLKVPAERVVILPGSQPVAFDELWYANASIRELPSPAPLMRLRDTLWRRLSLSRRPGRRKLFITRKKFRNRRLVNEEEVERLLLSKGFECISPEDMSISEQADCFASAEVVIGPCGAWATNMIFCQPDTPVILLNPAESCGLHFAYIAHWLSLRYVVALGCFVPTPSIGFLRGNLGYFDVETPDSMHYNYHVPLSSVETALASVG